MTRVDYETRYDRLRGETITAATLVFSDGSELWVDLTANAGRVALTHPAPQAVPRPGNDQTINDSRNDNNY